MNKIYHKYVNNAVKFAVEILGIQKPKWNVPIFKPQANHDSFFDGTEFCGNCGLIKKYGHRTAFRTSLDCRCKS